MNLTERSVQNLKVYMDSKGFFTSRASCEVDTVSRRKRAILTFRTVQGEPYRIDSISYEFQDKFLEQIILPDTAHTLLRTGNVFDVSVLDAERERITAYLKDRGYYNFSVNNILYRADTLVGGNRVNLRLVVRQNLAGYDERGRAMMEDNTIYRIDRINIFPDLDPTTLRNDSTRLGRLDTVSYRGLNVIYEKRLNLRPSLLRQSVPLYPNSVYNASQVSRTYSDLMALGYFKSAKISFDEQPRGADTANLISYIGETADTTQFRYTREGYLTCNIHCTPTLKQSFKVDLEGSTTSSFYGLTATVGYQNRNIFRGAESFDVSFTAGYEFMKAPDARKKRATEFGINTGLTFPRFLVPWRTRRFRSVNQPKTKVEVSVNFQDRPYYRRMLSSAGLTYMWSNDRYSSFSLRPIDINVVDVSNLDVSFLMVDNPDAENGQELTPNRYLLESFNTQFIGGLSFSYSYNNQRKNLGGNATNIRFNLETAGNLIGGVEHLFFSPSKNSEGHCMIFGIPYAQYFRTDLSVSRKIMLGEQTALVGRIYGGVAMAYGNSSSVPFDRQFYCGGSNGMRGWAPPNARAGLGARSAQFVSRADGRREAGGEPRTAFPDLEHPPRGDFLRSGQHLVHPSESGGVCRRSGLSFRSLLQPAGVQYRHRPAIRHQVRRAASRLGYSAPQPQQPGRRAVDPQLQVEEYGAQFRCGLSLLMYRAARRALLLGLVL